MLAPSCHPERQKMNTETKTGDEGSPAPNRLQVKAFRKDSILSNFAFPLGKVAYEIFEYDG